MASIAFDARSDTYHIRFRFRGREFKRSLSTSNRKLANAALGRVEETLMLIELGRLDVPPDSDPAQFILTDGKQTHALPGARLRSLQELFTAYQTQRLPGAKEPSTVKTEDLHIRHLLRVLKKSSFVQSLRTGELQTYVTKRLSEKSHGRPIAAETTRKELATLRVVWNWAIRQGYPERPAPVVGLEYPKRDERHPFRTWDEITAILAREGLTSAEEAELWESLYLTGEEVQEALEYAKAEALSFPKDRGRGRGKEHNAL